MDDIFIIAEEKSDHSYLLKIFNDSNSSVKFTVEEETHSALLFQYVLVSKNPMAHYKGQFIENQLGMGSLPIFTVGVH